MLTLSCHRLRITFWWGVRCSGEGHLHGLHFARFALVSRYGFCGVKRGPETANFPRAYVSLSNRPRSDGASALRPQEWLREKASLFFNTPIRTHPQNDCGLSRETDARGFTKRETRHARNARTAHGQSGVTPPLGRAKLRPHAAGGQTRASRRGTP